MIKLSVIWKNRSKIAEGIKNSVFKKEHIEEIASSRMEICESCPLIDKSGDECLVSGTEPCCGACGCSLKFKLRSLSSPCGDEDNPRWGSVLSEEDEDLLKESLNYEE